MMHGPINLRCYILSTGAFMCCVCISEQRAVVLYTASTDAWCAQNTAAVVEEQSG